MKYSINRVTAETARKIPPPTMLLMYGRFAWYLKAAATKQPAAITGRLASLADGGQISAIFTTGGTGVAPRDVTPEATRAVLDREIPGMAEVMRARGREATPLAALSRSVVGTRGLVLIVNLPGSPKGAVESLDAIVELAPHVLELLRGKTEHTSGPAGEV